MENKTRPWPFSKFGLSLDACSGLGPRLVAYLQDLAAAAPLMCRRQLIVRVFWAGSGWFEGTETIIGGP